MGTPPTACVTLESKEQLRGAVVSAQPQPDCFGTRGPRVILHREALCSLVAWWLGNLGFAGDREEDLGGKVTEVWGNLQSAHSAQVLTPVSTVELLLPSSLGKCRQTGSRGFQGNSRTLFGGFSCFCLSECYEKIFQNHQFALFTGHRKNNASHCFALLFLNS